MKRNYLTRRKFSTSLKLGLAFCFILTVGCAAAAPPEEIFVETAPPVAEASKINSPPESQGEPAGIFHEHNKLVNEKLRSLSIEEKIGQMLLVRCPESNPAQVIRDYKPGGFVLFKRDFEGKTSSQVAEMTKAFQQEASIPMIISVDEEGGQVVRFSSNPLIAETPFKSAQEIFRDEGMKAVLADGEKKAELMKELGLNSNLAPVVDICTVPTDYIYKRTFGGTPEETGEYASALVQVMQRKGIGCTLKHFPGYGSNSDTHTGASRDQRTREEFLQRDLVPFKMGIASGVHSIMISHNTVECFDPSLPMSVSPATKKLLRDELGFTGVIMTDDLAMDAAVLSEDLMAAEVLAVLAGNDMLIVTDYASAFDTIYRAVNSGDISQEIIDEAVSKILGWKYELGLL